MMDRKLNIIMIAFGAVGGVIGYYLGGWILSAALPKPLLAALYLGMLGLCIVGMCLLAETLFPLVNGGNWKRHYAIISWKYLVPIVVIPLLALGALMQGIYQFEWHFKQNRDIYMLIDRSGSMEQSDPADERLAAVQRLLDTFEKGDRVEIIAFDHTAEVMQPLIEAKSGENRDIIAEQLALIVPTGGTEFNEVLVLAYARVQENRSATREPVLILLSDGYSPLDDNYVQPFVQESVKINTVGFRLPDTDGEAVLAHIAQQTGGQFVMVDNTAELDLAFTDLYHSSDRFILTPKESTYIDGLQWLLFALTGLLLALQTAFVFDNRYLIKPLAVGGLLGGLLAGGLLCLPMPLLLPNIILGCLFTWFTLFCKSASSQPYDTYRPTADDSHFLSTGIETKKTRRQF